MLLLDHRNRVKVDVQTDDFTRTIILLATRRPRPIRMPSAGSGDLFRSKMWRYMAGVPDC